MGNKLIALFNQIKLLSVVKVVCAMLVVVIFLVCGKKDLVR